MHPQKRAMLIINVVGGIAVLGSYVYGITTHLNPGDALWGGVPDALRPLYSVSMLAATAGYFAFSGYLFFAVDPNTSLVGARVGFGIVNLLYAVILGASALWMPLTFAMLENDSEALWSAIRAVLAITGAGSLALLSLLLLLQPRRPRLPYVLAAMGLCAFAFQTAVLDAVIWPAYFRN